MNRIKSPQYLKRNWKLWGKEWKNKINQNKALGRTRLPSFRWKMGINKDLLENYLVIATQEHCSFCDKSELTYGTGATIEHFKPKGEYPNLAYQYNNLYNCCNQCQKKGRKYSDEILRPDDVNYRFETFFEIDILTGEIKPKITASNIEQQRAKATIKAYNLNNKDRKRLRKNVLETYRRNFGDAINALELNNFSFRFYIEEYLR